VDEFPLFWGAHAQFIAELGGFRLSETGRSSRQNLPNFDRYVRVSGHDFKGAKQEIPVFFRVCKQCNFKIKDVLKSITVLSVGCPLVKFYFKSAMNLESLHSKKTGLRYVEESFVDKRQTQDVTEVSFLQNLMQFDCNFV
jgi:hypothetical protein